MFTFLLFFFCFTFFFPPPLPGEVFVLGRTDPLWSYYLNGYTSISVNQLSWQLKISILCCCCGAGDYLILNKIQFMFCFTILVLFYRNDCMGWYVMRCCTGWICGRFARMVHGVWVVYVIRLWIGWIYEVIYVRDGVEYMAWNMYGSLFIGYTWSSICVWSDYVKRCLLDFLGLNPVELHPYSCAMKGCLISYVLEYTIII